MKNTLKILALAFVAAFTIGSCNKYEEGPAFSLLSKKARLVGDWLLVNIYVNDTETTVTGMDVLHIYSKSGIHKFIDEYTDVNGNISNAEGNWQFGPEKESVIFTYTSPTGIVDQNKILRLERKELWLKREDPSETVEWHYVLKQ
jgi:hypothetical protein